MNWIAFDAAFVKTGWAYRVPDTEGWTWRTGVFCPMECGAKTIIRVVHEAASCGIRAAAIEDCYLKFNPATFQKLAAAKARIQLICEFFELEVETFLASEWQSFHRINGARGARKRGSLKRARELGATVFTDDEADAVCLCEYVTMRGKQQEFVLRGPRGGKLRGV